MAMSDETYQRIKSQHVRDVLSSSNNPKWKDEWLPPRLKSPTFIGKEDVGDKLIAQMEIWKSDRGYYVYFRYHTGYLYLSSGPYKRESTALNRAKAGALALQGKGYMPQKLYATHKCPKCHNSIALPFAPSPSEHYNAYCRHCHVWVMTTGQI